MTNQKRVDGLRQRAMRKTSQWVLGVVAIASVGCATTIAGRHPHLDRRSVCLVVPGIESDSTEYVFTNGNVPVSNFDRDAADEAAETARTVFEYDPNADPSSVRYLPAPYNELTCPERFRMLPSIDAQVKPLPVAAINLLLHERRPEPVSKALAEELAKCSKQINGPVNPIQHSMQLNVYVTNQGQTAFAYVADSTIGNGNFNACVVNVLRATQWPAIASSMPNVAAAPVALKGLFAQPAPAQPQPDAAPESGIRRIQPPLVPPAENPGGARPVPRIFVIPLGPIAAAVLVFGLIYFWSDNEAPAWASEMNPITRQPYTSWQEYQEVQWLSPEEIAERQAAHIKATQPQPPPAPPPAPVPPPAPPPAPTLTPQQQREQEKLRERCTKLAKKIEEILNAKRKGPPKNGYPQGPKGITERWSEIAANKGKWGYQPDGKPGKQLQGHLDEYDKGQEKLIDELRLWQKTGCDDKEHGLPHNARQYAAQKPEIGPGKPLEPAPTPVYTPALIPPVIALQPKKTSK